MAVTRRTICSYNGCRERPIFTTGDVTVCRTHLELLNAFRRWLYEPPDAQFDDDRAAIDPAA